MQQGNRIILVLGILAIAAGIAVYFEASSFQGKSTLTEGKVVYVLGSSYRIQFHTPDGAERIIRGSGKTHGYREGNSARVWYRTDNPDRARLSDGKKGGKKIVVAGLVCILLGVYPLFQKKKNDTPAQF